MTRKNTISVSRLRELLSLNPSDGTLTWRVWRGGKATAGSPALTALNSKGYPTGYVDGRPMLRSRVVFALHHGRWPVGNVDHADGNPLNNRPCNLREATFSENARNRKRRVGGSSEYHGVHKQKNRWIAAAGVDGKGVYLGCFADEIDAARAYDKFASKTHGKFAKLNFPEIGGDGR